METLIVKLKGKENSKKLSEILRSMNFVEEVNEMKSNQLLDQIRLGLIQVKAIKEGKLKGKTISEIVNEK